VGYTTYGVLFYGITVNINEINETEHDDYDFIEEAIKKSGANLEYMQLGHYDNDGSQYAIFSKMHKCEWDQTIEVENIRPIPYVENDFFLFCDSIGIERIKPKWLVSSYVF